MYDELETYAKLGRDHEDRPTLRVDLWYPHADQDPPRPRPDYRVQTRVWSCENLPPFDAVVKDDAA